MSNKFKKLVEYFAKLPGIGPRQATRLVLAMIDWTENDIKGFSDSLMNLKNGPVLCSECFNFADTDKCAICASTKRDKTRIAVVERVTDLESIEKTGHYNGVYHVLGGVISPAYDKLPSKLKIPELISRINSLKKHPPAGGPDIEVILATNPNTYGETTAMYLEQELAELGVRTTRLARGLASGSSVEYADDITLGNALKHRK